jgi:two-component system chemotaxis sensor kinase CheA
MHLDLDLDAGDERLFTDEAYEHIDRIEQGLLELERAETGSPVVNEVFRAAHTLKGSAATIGHRRMAELTHAMENVFGALRSGSIPTLAAFADTLLETIDVLRALVDEVVARETITDAPEELARTLRVLLDGATGSGAQQPPPGASATAGAASATFAMPSAPAVPSGLDPDIAELVAASPSEEPVTAFRCAVDPASDWQAVRLLQAVMEAEESGHFIASTPDRATIETGESGALLLLLVAGGGSDLDALRSGLASVDEFRIVSEHPVPGTAADGAATAADGPALAGAEDAAMMAAADGAGGSERRAADLGVEARGLKTGEQLALAGDRLKAAQQTIRIDVSRLDEVMNLIGELVVLKTRFLRQANEVGTRLGDDPLARGTDESSQSFARIASQLQDQVTRLRMLPIETVFNRFPRVVRDLAAKLGKEVDLVIEGKETELDRSVLDEVGDPLGHLVRNALDHGVETPEEREAAGKSRRGTVRLTARHADGQVVITVADDGHGIDAAKMRQVAVRKGMMNEGAAAALDDQEAVELVFAAGFSTAARVTDVSGRGVGMDVVRTNIEKLGGRVAVSTKVGHGSRFDLSLPLTLAIIGALLVKSGHRVCSLPLTGVVETLRVPRDAIHQIRGRLAIELRGRVVPIELLDNALGDRRRALEAGERGFVNLVVIRSRGRELALAVDQFLGEQEIVLKSLGGVLGRVPGVAGATVMADGSVALVIDIAALIDRMEAAARGGSGTKTALRRIA